MLHWLCLEKNKVNAMSWAIQAAKYEQVFIRITFFVKPLLPPFAAVAQPYLVVVRLNTA